MARQYRNLPEPSTQDIERFWCKVDKTPGLGPQGDCWFWTCRPGSAGYGFFQYARMPQHINATRFAYLIQHHCDPDQKMVCHHCDTPICVRGDHLFLGSAKENGEDAARKRRFRHGENHPESKLTKEQALAIRTRSRAGEETISSIAREFNISLRLVQNIRSGKAWAYLDEYLENVCIK